MAGYKSTYLANEILDHVLGAAAYSAPATVYIALFTTLPEADGTGGTEVSGGSYARVSVTNNSTNFPAAAAGRKTNGTAITFASPTANWGTLAGAAVMDASSGGNFLYIGPFSIPKTVNNGDPAFEIPAGAGVFTEA